MPIFTTSLVLKQLGLSIGIPFGVLLLFLIHVKAYYGVMMVVVMLLLSFLFIIVVYGGKYDVEYSIDQKGVSCRYQEKQRKKNKVINTVLILTGLFTGKPTYAGAGILAASRQEEFMSWKNVKKIKFVDRNSIILLEGGFAENITLFCEVHQYEQIKSMLGKYVKRK